jgi:hypothetical protein
MSDFREHPMAQIAEVGGSEVIGAICTHLEASARERESIEDFLRRTQEEELAYWMNRCFDAEARLERIENRMLWGLS